MQITPIKISTNYCRNTSFKARTVSGGYKTIEQKRNTDLESLHNSYFCNSFVNLQPDKQKRQEFLDFIKSPGRLKKEDYDSLEEDKKANLNRFTEDYLKVHYFTKHKLDPNIFVKSGLFFKSCFDKKYGQDNYRVISIGTSPSNCAQVMEYLGCDVKYLPVSGIHSTEHEKDSVYYSSCENMKILMNYLKGKGFKKDNKKTILIDYTVTGHTINVMKDCIMDYFNIDKNDIECYDIIDTLTNEDNSDINIPVTMEEINKLSTRLNFQDLEDISPVPHFYMDNYSNLLNGYPLLKRGTNEEIITKRFDEYSKPLSKALSIYFLKEIEKL